jgi:hypothetical protein
LLLQSANLARAVAPAICCQFIFLFFNWLLICEIGQIMRKTKCQSGAEKKKKRQRLEAATQSQKGALDRFVVKEPQINSENQTPDANVDDGHGDNAVEVEVRTAEHDEGDDGNSGDELDEGNDANIGVEGNDTNIGVEGNEATVRDDTNSSSHPDIFDPRYWDDLDPKMIDILL